MCKDMHNMYKTPNFYKNIIKNKWREGDVYE